MGADLWGLFHWQEQKVSAVITGCINKANNIWLLKYYSSLSLWARCAVFFFLSLSQTPAGGASFIIYLSWKSRSPQLLLGALFSIVFLTLAFDTRAFLFLLPDCIVCGPPFFFLNPHVALNFFFFLHRYLLFLSSSSLTPLNTSRDKKF